jgi:hypothetical protein
MDGQDYSASVNNQAVTGAVSDTITDKSNDILKMAIEMTGKQAVVDGQGNIKAIGSKDDIAGLEDGSFSGESLGIDERAAFATLLGVEENEITNATISTTGSGDDEVITVSVEIDSTGNGEKNRSIGVKLNLEGKVTHLAEKEGTSDITENDFGEVDAEGVLESWGLDSELSAGQLFFIQQQMTMIKNIISTISTTGKSFSDIKRDATQKFSQSS